MTFDLGAALPDLLPRAITWAREREQEILRTGVPLKEFGLSLAQSVGVQQPELIRVEIIDTLLPLPSDSVLRAAGLATGLFGPHMAGITLGYSICIRRDYNSIRLLSHECRHVYQYELAGGVAAFLPLYLKQIAQFGYRNAPYEIDARAYEVKA